MIDLDEKSLGTEKTALSLAINSNAKRDSRTSIVELLLSHGATPKILDTNSFSALHHAAVKGLAEVVEILLRNGANFEEKVQRGHTPIMLAAKYGHAGIVSCSWHPGQTRRQTVLCSGERHCTQRKSLDIRRWWKC